MTDFWPSGLEMDDTASPEVILSNANKEWAEKSGGVINLVIQDAESKRGDRLLIVHAKHVPSNRTVKLFSVLHRPNAPYPARIYPEGDAVPDYLKKTYYEPGYSLRSMGVLGVTEGHEVTNEGVCDTPAEFRRRLSKAFNEGVVKSEVLSLIAGVTPPPGPPPDTTSTAEVRPGS